MPPKASYADRVFTTDVVSYPEIVHIGDEKDFTLLSKRRLNSEGTKKIPYLQELTAGKRL